MLSISRTYWILTDFYGGMIMKKTEVAPIEYQRCNILRLEPYRSVRSNSEPTEAFIWQLEALRSVGPSEMVPTPD